ncbi:Aste57867_16085 [Aphanomyces stellatus]|uniref:Aste57867_16085 protein n=1 Tax=Aphanomyces stellatus TaxID=120398 RepID=A0A485L4P7_9STRA|nr:hypothetical protein As57867_016029 [Aphanomyces stellatus]VFT92868.1 Aste57867_16085 [Aphanomyces stellatus]
MQMALISARAAGKEMATHAPSAVFTVGTRVAQAMPRRNSTYASPSPSPLPFPHETLGTPPGPPPVVRIKHPPRYMGTAPWNLRDKQYHTRLSDSIVLSPVVYDGAARSRSQSAMSSLGTPPSEATPRCKRVVGQESTPKAQRERIAAITKRNAVARLQRTWRACRARVAQQRVDATRLRACLCLQALARRWAARRRVELLRAPSGMSFHSLASLSSTSTSSHGSDDNREDVLDLTWHQGPLGVTFGADSHGHAVVTALQVHQNACRSDDMTSMQLNKGDRLLRLNQHQATTIPMVARLLKDLPKPIHLEFKRMDQASSPRRVAACERSPVRTCAVPTMEESTRKDVIWDRQTHPMLGVVLSWSAKHGLPVVQTVMPKAQDVPCRVGDLLTHVQHTSLQGIRTWRALLQGGTTKVLVLRFERPNDMRWQSNATRDPWVFDKTPSDSDGSI